MGNGSILRGQGYSCRCGMPRIHQIKRPLLGFFVQPPQVLADQAQRHQLHATQEQDDGHHGRPARHRIAEQQRLGDHVKREGERQQRRDHAQIGRHAQGRRGETGDAFQREVPQLPESEAAVARDACLAMVGQRLLVEPHPAEQPLHETMPLAQFAQRRQRPRRQQAEVAGIGGDGRLRQAADHAVERVRGGPLQPAFAIAGDARAVDVVVAGPPFAHELADQLRRILSVGVQDDGRAGVHPVQARGQRRLLAEVARQPHDRHARVVRRQRTQHVPCGVAAAIVHIQHAAPHVLQRVQRSDDAWMQHRQGLCFVVGGHHHGDLPGTGAAHRSASR